MSYLEVRDSSINNQRGNSICSWISTYILSIFFKINKYLWSCNFTWYILLCLVWRKVYHTLLSYSQLDGTLLIHPGSTVLCRFTFYMLAQVVSLTHSSANSSANGLFPEDLKMLWDLSDASSEVLWPVTQVDQTLQ